jgi:hypothetical protein
MIMVEEEEGKNKIISTSNFGVLTWPTTAVVKNLPIRASVITMSDVITGN